MKMLALVLTLTAALSQAAEQGREDRGPSIGTQFVPVLDTTTGLRASSGDQLQGGVQLDAPWHLDRVDQAAGPLDGVYAAQVRCLCSPLCCPPPAHQFAIADCCISSWAVFSGRGSEGNGRSGIRGQRSWGAAVANGKRPCTAADRRCPC